MAAEKPIAPMTRRSTDEDVDYYIPDADVPELPQAARQLLEDYSGIPPDQVRTHVLEIRKLAWQIFPFPCIGSMRFLSLSLSTQPSYTKILSLLSNHDDPHTLLDVGCCFGQDLRKLILDGAPASQIIGLDMRSEFIDLGYNLFRDRASYAGQFVVGDIFDDNSTSAVTALHGKADIVHIAAFLHLFGWEGQIEAVVRLMAFLKDKPGTMILGRQRGDREPGEFEHPAGREGVCCSHDERTFRRMWDKVEEKTGTRWRLELRLELKVGASPAGVDMLYFEGTRIE